MSDESIISENGEFAKTEKKRIKLAETRGIELIELRDDLYQDLAKYGAQTIGELGSGSHASVYLIVIKDKNYACKVFEIERYEDDDEMSIGSSIPDMAFSTLLKHPLIIETREVLLSYQTTWEGIDSIREYIYIIMEVGDKSLSDELGSKNLNYMQREAIIYQIGTALKCISSMGLVHCDVKSPNVIIKKGVAKLADFGIMRLKENYIDNFCQTVGFKAPEIFYDWYDSYYEKKYSKKIHGWKLNQKAIEIWSFGVTCLEILYNTPQIFTRTDRVVDPDIQYQQHEYMTMHRILMDRLVETDDVFGELIKIFGSPGKDEEVVMRKVCDMLLQPDQDMRIRGYEEFLNIPHFRAHRSPQFDNFSIQKRQLPIIHNISTININRVVSWLFELTEEHAIPHFVLFNAVELFLRVGLKYAKKLDEVLLTAVVCLYITASIHHHDELFSIETLHSMIDDAKTILEIQNKILEIMAGEKGNLIIDSIYDYLPDYQTMQGAMFYLTNIEKYIACGGSPRELSLRLYEHQSNGVFNIRGKPNIKKNQFKYFTYLSPEDRKTILKRLQDPTFKDITDHK